MNNKMRPIHPGEILKDELDELEISAAALAQELSVPANRISQILSQKRSITADTALRLAKFFKMSPEFWLDLQTAFDIRTAILKEGSKIDKEVHTWIGTEIAAISGSNRMSK